MKSGQSAHVRLEVLCIVLLLLALLSAGMAYSSAHKVQGGNAGSTAITATPAAASEIAPASPTSAPTEDVRLTDGIITWAVIIVVLILGGTLFSVRRRRR